MELQLRKPCHFSVWNENWECKVRVCLYLVIFFKHLCCLNATSLKSCTDTSCWDEWKQMRVITPGVGKSLFTFHCLFFVYWMYVCVFAPWLNVSIWTYVCVIVFTVSPCVYICTEFYFASLILNSILCCFYSVWIQMYREVCSFLLFFKLSLLEESLHLLTMMLEQTSLHSRLIFLTFGGHLDLLYMSWEWRSQEKSFTTTTDKSCSIWPPYTRFSV